MKSFFFTVFFCCATHIAYASDPKGFDFDRLSKTVHVETKFSCKDILKKRPRKFIGVVLDTRPKTSAAGEEVLVIQADLGIREIPKSKLKKVEPIRPIVAYPRLMGEELDLFLRLEKALEEDLLLSFYPPKLKPLLKKLADKSLLSVPKYKIAGLRPSLDGTDVVIDLLQIGKDADPYYNSIYMSTVSAQQIDYHKPQKKK